MAELFRLGGAPGVGIGGVRLLEPWRSTAVAGACAESGAGPRRLVSRRLLPEEFWRAARPAAALGRMGRGIFVDVLRLLRRLDGMPVHSRGPAAVRVHGRIPLRRQ